MQKTITFNAKCRQCMHFEILDEEDEFLSEDKTYCRLDSSLKKDEDECINLQLDEKALKSVLRDSGIFNVRIM
jgi:hypothetical protein